MGEIIIEETNYRFFILTLINFIMFVAGIAIVVYGVVYGIPLCKYPGIVFSIIVLVEFLRNLYRTKSIRPLLIIAYDGITDASGSSPFYIPYIEIERFAIANIFGSSVIGVYPKNNEDFISKLSPIHQRAAKERLKMQLPPFIIPVQRAKDMLIEDIFSLLEKRLSDYSRLYN